MSDAPAKAPAVRGVDVTTTGATALRTVMRSPIWCAPDATVRSALAAMRTHAIGSILVAAEDATPVGIFTLRDVVDRVVLVDGALEQPISSVMSTGLHTLPPDATVHDAVLLMLARGVRHVLVVESRRLVGLVSEKDLFALQPLTMRRLAAAIRSAGDVEHLVSLSADIRALARELLDEGTAPGPLTELISSLNDLLTQRILDVELAGAEPEGIRFCWIALGSEGRSEQTLHSDQDNGIIFEGTRAADDVRARLVRRAARANEALARCGFPLCAGNIMASNPEWCLSLGEWEQRFANWIGAGDPQSLLNASIFFDFRPIHGDRDLAGALRRDLLERTGRSPRFLRQMAGNALRNRPPLGLLGDFATTNSKAGPRTIDLKLNAAMIFSDAARIYALASGVPHTNTCDRLREFAHRTHLAPLEAQAWIDAFLLIQVMRLRAQHAQSAAGEPLSNRIDPMKLNELEQRVLKEALRQARRLQSRLAMDYQL